MTPPGHSFDWSRMLKNHSRLLGRLNVVTPLELLSRFMIKKNSSKDQIHSSLSYIRILCKERMHRQLLRYLVSQKDKMYKAHPDCSQSI